MSAHLIYQLNVPYISLLAFYIIKCYIVETPESQNKGVSNAGFGKLTLKYLASFILIGKKVSQD